ncbi:hypothetical protein HZP46_05730 [Elizabethkingia anophelis]|nr:hypothetical protein [Elizabethkingia anophelis]
MYRTYIIIFELDDNAHNKDLIDYLKSFSAWARITDNSFAIKVKDLKAKEIRNELLKYKGDSGRIFVIKSGVEAAWSNVRGRNQWFKDNL